MHCAAYFSCQVFSFVIGTVSEPYQSILRLNPLATFIEMYRAILMHAQWPHWGHLGLLLLASLGLCVVGNALINRFDCVYPKLN